MSALGFLGGLGTTVGAMQKGYEQSEDREAVRKDREFLEGQRQRKLEEQRREDALRTADASVATTEEIDDPSWVAPEQNSNAVAQVTVGEDGVDQVAQPAAPKAPKVTRKRGWDAIMADYANNRRKVGDVAGAVKFEEQADAASFKQAAQSFQQWSSNTPDTANLYDAAQSAAKMYNSDRLPGKVTNISQPAADGSVTVTLKNGSTGESFNRTFKTVADLKTGLESYYSPETYAAYVKSRREAAIKAEEKILEERSKPVTTPAGAITTFGAGDPRGRVVNDNGFIDDGTGHLIKPTKGGAGSGTSTGKGGKANDPLSAVTDMVFDSIKESAAKGALEPGQVTRANTLGRQLVSSAMAEGRNIDPAVATELAIGVATGKTPVVPAFNPKTGTIDNVVEYQGNKFSVENLGKPGSARMDNKQLSSVAVNYISSLPEEQRAQMVAAAYNQDALGKLNSSLEQRARSPEAMAALEQRLGRKPTEDDITRVVRATQDAVRPSLELISRYATLSDEGKRLTIGIAKEAGYTTDFKSTAPQNPAAGAGLKGAPTDAGAGLGMRPRMTQQERRATVEEARQRKEQADAELARQAPIEARRLLQSGNIEELAKFQQSPAFGKLDFNTKQEIFKRVNGVQ